MNLRSFLAALALLGAVATQAGAAETALSSSYVPSGVAEVEITGLQTSSTVTGDDDSARFALASLQVTNNTGREVQVTVRLERDDTEDTTLTFTLSGGTHTVQVPERYATLADGSHTWEVYYTQNVSSGIVVGTASFLGVYPPDAGWVTAVGGDITAVGSCATDTCFQTGTDNTFLGHDGTGQAAMRAIDDDAVPNTITVDLAASATALAANPTDCSANQFANAIAASGNLTCAQPAFSDLSGSATDAQVPNTITVDLAASATALAANGSNCDTGDFPLGVSASGAAESCSRGVQVVIKTAAESVTNNTLQNDDHLLFAIATSEVVTFETNLWLSAGSSTDDIQFAFTVPAGATLAWNFCGNIKRDLTTGDPLASAGVTASGGAIATHGATTQNYNLCGTVTNGANAGNVQLQWANNGGGGATTTMTRGSTLQVIRE